MMEPLGLGTLLEKNSLIKGGCKSSLFSSPSSSGINNGPHTIVEHQVTPLQSVVGGHFADEQLNALDVDIENAMNSMSLAAAAAENGPVGGMLEQFSQVVAPNSTMPVQRRSSMLDDALGSSAPVAIPSESIISVLSFQFSEHF